MPNYMLLLYASDPSPEEHERRMAEVPEWRAVSDRMREAGVMIANDPLHSKDTATTVRVRDGQTEMVDGPFAVTKEILAGYFLLDCPDLDEALRWAALLPIARYGSVEVRPVGRVVSG